MASRQAQEPASPVNPTYNIIMLELGKVMLGLGQNICMYSGDEVF